MSSGSGRSYSFICNLIIGVLFSCKAVDQTSDSSIKSSKCYDYPGCFQTQVYPEPSSIEFSRQSLMCNLWKKAHNHLPQNYQKMIHALVDTLDYVSIEKFDREMKEQVRKLKKKLGPEEVFAIVDRNKSSEWLASRILYHEDYRDLKFSFQLIDSQWVSEFLYDRKIKNLKTNLVRFDDASYSGKQMLGYISEFRYNNPSVDLTNLYIVLPYFSQMAKDLLAKEISREKNIFVFPENLLDVKIQANIRGLKTVLKEHGVYGYFKALYPEVAYDSAELSHVFFQHKVADSISVFIDFIRGNGIVKNIEQHSKNASMYESSWREIFISHIDNFKQSSNGLPFQIPCVPFVNPPYKKNLLDQDYFHLQTYLDHYDSLKNHSKIPLRRNEAISLDDLKIWKEEQDRFIACLKACPDDGRDCQCDTKITNR